LKNAIADAPINSFIQIGAIKYAVRLMFCLPSEDDPEKSNTKPNTSNSPSHDALVSEAQRKRLYALIREAGLDNDAAKNFLSKWGYSSSTQILRRDYDAICNAISAPKRGESQS
jgi:hypothetical protein